MGNSEAVFIPKFKSTRGKVAHLFWLTVLFSVAENGQHQPQKFNMWAVSRCVCGKKANSALAHILRGAILTDSFYLFFNLHRPDDSWESPEAHSLPGPNQTSIHSGPEPAVERLVSSCDCSRRWAHDLVWVWNMVSRVNTILLLTTSSLITLWHLQNETGSKTSHL